MAAAGSGERLGAGGPKAFVQVAGKPLLAWSLDAFAASKETGAVVVAAPPGEEGRAAEIAGKAGLEDAIVVAGGQTRAESVAAALKPVSGELVAVHDAARPLVTAELIDALAALLRGRPDADAAIAAAPITDTLKRVAPGRGGGADVPVKRTESREGLWGAQTPQLCRTARLLEAIDSALPQAQATDEAMLIEAVGGTVLMHRANGHNLKVTTAADLRLVEALLSC